MSNFNIAVIATREHSHMPWQWTLLQGVSSEIVAKGYAGDKALANRVAEAVKRLMECD